MAFGFGGSKSSNKSNTQIKDIIDSESGMDYQSGFDSGNKYSSGGSSGYDNFAGGSYQDSVFGGNQFENMMKQFGGMFQQFMGPGGGMGNINRSAGGASDFMGDVAGGAMTAYDRLKAGGATGATGAAVDPALRESLMSSMADPSQTGKMYQDIVGGAGNTYIDPMVSAMRDDAAIGMNRSVSDLNARTGAGGQQRGSRAGLAEGLMRSEGARDVGNREVAMRAGAYDKDLDWKMKIAEQADLGRGQAQDRAIGLLGSGDANTMGALGQSGNMQNLGMGMMAPWMQSSMMPFQMGGMYSNMMGQPTVLGGGEYGSGGSGFSDTFSGGEGFDTGSSSGSSFEDYMRDYFANQSTKGKSTSLSMGL